jgi:hypothetical protein
VEGGALVFEPRFGLQPGLRYRAVFHPTRLSAHFDIPKPDRAPSTRVEQVYPSRNVLPENQLKLYLHFSAPMSRGEAYRRVRLLDEIGAAVELPFLELDEELWDPEGKRLTILFDPGRIKTGLQPQRELGTPLREGRSYTLVVDREWMDAEGSPLREGFRKAFRAGASDRQPPDPKTWRLHAPRGGTTEPLVVEFPEPMDQALLMRLLEVTDRKANAIEGTIEVDREETRWRFTPRQPWKSGSYSLTVGTILEDLAGNSINKPFEVDVFERVTQRIARETVALPFTVQPGGGT